MTFLQISSVLIVLAGAFAAINSIFLRLPSAIGILIVSLSASFFLLCVDLIWPTFDLLNIMHQAVDGFGFSAALLEGMLGLLLFAGALHVKLSDLKENWRVVLLMATMGVALSTVIAGVGFSWITGAPIMIALVFGALISPTDPVAVLGHTTRSQFKKIIRN